MGLKISKKKYPKRNKNELNYPERKSIQKFVPPTSNEPVMSLEKLNDTIGFCGFSNGCLSVLNFDKLHIKFSVNAHSKEITKIKSLKRSCLLSSVSRDKSIKLWTHIDDGGLDEELRCDLVKEDAHELVITGLDVSNDEKSLVTGSRDNTVKLWDVSRLTEKSVCKLSRNLVTCVKYSPQNLLIGVTGEDKIIRLMDPKSLEVIKEFPKKNYIQTHCDISDDERYLVSSSNGFNGSGCELTIWDIRTNRILSELNGHQGTVTCCQFLPNSWFSNPLNNLNQNSITIASCGHDSCVTLWTPTNIGTSNNNIYHQLIDISASTVHFIPGGGVLTTILPITKNRIAVATNNSGIVVLEYNPTCGSLYHVGSI